MALNVGDIPRLDYSESEKEAPFGTKTQPCPLLTRNLGFLCYNRLPTDEAVRCMTPTFAACVALIRTGGSCRHVHAPVA